MPTYVELKGRARMRSGERGWNCGDSECSGHGQVRTTIQPWHLCAPEIPCAPHSYVQMEPEEPPGDTDYGEW